MSVSRQHRGLVKLILRLLEPLRASIRALVLLADLVDRGLDLIQLVFAVEQALQIKGDDKGAAWILGVEDLLRVARRAYLSAPAPQ